LQKKKALILKGRGSLTVEAAVVLPFFLFVFIIFLFVIKAVYVQSILDQVVKETTQEIAAISYPFSFFNEWEDEALVEGGISNKDEFPNAYSEFFRDILTGNLTNANFKEMLKIIYSGSPGNVQQPIEAELIRKLSIYYLELQDKGKFALVDKVISQQLETHDLDRKRFTLCLVHLPQSDFGYNNTKHDESYQKTGLLPEQDFSKDDIVIQAQYNFSIPLPFLSQNTVLLKSTSIERAWLHGGNGIYTDRTEKGLFEQAPKDVESIVYVTRTGVKYHLSGCRYLQKSKIPMLREEAITSYKPCKVCCPP